MDSLDPDETRFNKSASLSKETCASLYSMGYNFYKNGKYSEAAGCFSFLVLADSNSPKYWMGFGSSQMMTGNYEEALTSFGLASELDVHNPQPHFNAAECFFALQRGALALKALDNAEQLAKANNNNQDLLSRITALRESWS